MVDPETAAASCQPLLDESVQCGTLYPELDKVREDEIFLIGLIAQRPTDLVPDEDYGGPTTLGIHLAVDEINLGGGVEVSGRRKLLIVECNETPVTRDEQRDSEERKYLAPRVDHLVETLRVPAILGPSTSGAAEPIHQTHLANETTLLLSSSATRNELTRNRRPGSNVQLFWRTVPPDEQQIPAVVDVLDLVQEAVASRGSSSGLSIVTITDTSNPANEELQFDLSMMKAITADVRYTSGDAEMREQAIERIKARKPQIIVPFTTGDFVANILPELESGSTAADKPWYVMTEGNRTSFAKALGGTGASDLPTRVIGTAPGPRETDEYDRFERAFRDTYGEGDIGNLAEFGYDAAFLLAFAITKAATKSPSLDGPALARAIRDLDCKEDDPITLEARGLDYRSRTDDITSTPDGCFDVRGASGPLNYEATRHSAGSYTPEDLDGESSNMALWCLPDAMGGTANLTYHFEQPDGIVPKSPPLALTGADWRSKALNP